MKILVAEDDPVNSTLIVAALNRLGHELLIVTNGIEAERLLIREPSIRLVISDWVMPGLDGLELCQRLRKRNESLYTYFLLITARTGLDARLAGYKAGVDDFLSKPLNLEELMARVEIARRILEMQGELVRRSEELEALKQELELRNEKLADMAITDALTGLRNRRHFHRTFDSHFVLGQQSGQPLTVILIDVDRFKHYNDSFGHPAGDEALIQVADVLRSNVRDRDLVARYGGEEFVVLLPRVGAPEGIALAERLRRCIADRPWRFEPITASFGVGSTNTLTPNSEVLLDQADRALYFSKRRGRNCVTHFRELGPRTDRPAIAHPGSPRPDLPIAATATGLP